MQVTKHHVETFKAAFYNNTADETADPVEIALKALFAGLTTPTPNARYVNRADGKICTFVSEEDGLVTFKWKGRETPRYLCRAEFDERFHLETCGPSPQADVEDGK